MKAHHCRISGTLKNISAEHMTVIRRMSAKRDELESRFVSLGEEVDVRRDELRELDESLTNKRGEISKILEGSRNPTSKIRTALSLLKKECTEIDLRIRLGLHELNRTPPEGNTS